MRHSLYWDDFERRVEETTCALKCGKKPPIRRVAVFITDACNFKCAYCNHKQNPVTLSKEKFMEFIEDFGQEALIHITGGEPSVVPWLYPLIDDIGDFYRIHLNTNAFLTPPKKVKRLKVSLDHFDPDYFNRLVGVKSFDRIVENIKEASKHTVTSVTYTLTAENYKDCIEFAKFSNLNFPDLYAEFFSVYKGTNPRFAITDEVAEDFFTNILPELKSVLRDEARKLIEETIDEKARLMQGVRFEQNLDNNPCYLSMSEAVISPYGEIFTCSHLYRDRVFLPFHNAGYQKHEKCRYGCNRRLVAFNEAVHSKLL